MKKVDVNSLKESKKAKRKALNGSIVLKNNCPYDEDVCVDECEANKCNKL